MHHRELQLALQELAQAELDDAALHQTDATIEERLRSHDRLARLRAHVDQLRALDPNSGADGAARAVRRAAKGVRIFPNSPPQKRRR